MRNARDEGGLDLEKLERRIREVVADQANKPKARRIMRRVLGLSRTRVFIQDPR